MMPRAGVNMPVGARLAAAALLAPLVLAAATLAAIALAERAGGTFLAGAQPRNSAEAAGMAQPAAMLRYLDAGDEVRRVYPVHPDIISSSVLYATTLEAAVWSRQPGILELLDRRGAFAADAERLALACLAADLSAGDLVEYLDPGGEAACAAGTALDAVLARTRDAGNAGR